MEEKNELNDIILNRGGAGNNNKKIILAVATLGVILIVVVMLMNSIAPSGTDNLPQAVLPPKPELQVEQPVQDEPLFEDVKVLKDENQDNNNLDEIAKKLKQESQTAQPAQEETPVVAEQEPALKAEKEVAKTVVPQAPAHVKERAPSTKTSASGSYYIQVGSFSRHEPNKKLLKSITDKGYTYKYQSVSQTTKVLVGPFNTNTEAREALKVIRSSIEAGAFITKL